MEDQPQEPHRGDSIELSENDDRRPRELPGLGPWRGLYPDEDSACTLVGKYVRLQVPVRIAMNDGQSQFGEAGSVLFWDGERYVVFDEPHFQTIRSILGRASSSGNSGDIRIDLLAARLMRLSQSDDKERRREKNERAAVHAVDAAEALAGELQSRRA